MFNFFKKDFKLLSVADGKTIDLSSLSDPIFSQRMAGDGIAIDMTGDTIVAPCTGELSLIFKTNHAFAMTLENGIEVLVHIGIDNIDLDSAGFERLIEPEQIVTTGTPIIKIDPEFLASQTAPVISAVLITNPDHTKSLTPIIGQTVKAGIDEVISYR